MQLRGIRYSLCFMSGVLMMLLIITGCTDSEPSWTTFVGSAVEKSFPVPKEAKRTETATNNTKVDYVHYSMPGLREDDPVPEPYVKAITEWGWKENTKESTGTTLVFTKDKLVVQLTMHKNAFTVLVPKMQEKTIIKGLESNQ
ncbi:hypothetical protein [Paenibacillus antibioticophila]|uniref:hypothetical protein n=1 Tax=Paenibacillus antibioticophila TaxID=1274374 RepID=UPI0005CA4F5A|nr:hypothetical protein [Paenibacillus antibioticophila]